MFIITVLKIDYIIIYAHNLFEAERSFQRFPFHTSIHLITYLYIVTILNIFWCTITNHKYINMVWDK